MKQQIQKTAILAFFAIGSLLAPGFLQAQVSGSGTTNYVPLFNGTTTVTNSLLYQSSGKIGIGTNAPQQLLHLNATTTRTGMYISSDGDAAAYSDIAFRTNTTNTSFATGVADAWYISHRKDGFFSGGVSGVTGTSLEFYTTRKGGGYFAPLVFKANGDVVIASPYDPNGSTVSGKVGIGTVSPRGQFDVAVAGDIWLSKNGLNSGTQTLYLPGHVYFAPYDNSNIAYVQARRSDNTGSTAFQFRTWNSGAMTDAMFIGSTGQIGIGTSNPGTFKLAVEGSIGARSVKVTNTTPWPDYVFESIYTLKPLLEVEKYIQQNKHLPDVPSAAQVAKEGINLGEMDAMLLKKIEELTLYMIDQNKQMMEMKKENIQLKQEVADLKQDKDAKK